MVGRVDGWARGWLGAWMVGRVEGWLRRGLRAEMVGWQQSGLDTDRADGYDLDSPLGHVVRGIGIAGKESNR